MKFIVDLLADWSLWLILIAILSFVTAAFFGTRWEKSGLTAATRKTYLIRISQVLMPIAVLSLISFVISLVVIFLRAV